MRKVDKNEGKKRSLPKEGYQTLRVKHWLQVNDIYKLDNFVVSPHGFCLL